MPKNKISVIDKLLEIVYPRKCMFCGSVLPYGKDVWACRNCSEPDNLPICEDFKIDVPIDFDIFAAFSVFEYTGTVREALFKLKFESVSGYGTGLARLAHKYLASDYFDDMLKDIHYFIPIPLHKSRKRDRGFNQAETICAELAYLYDKPMETGVVERKRKTKSQFSLNKRERQENMKGVFNVLLPEKIVHKNILIIDDIYTTGATVNECAKAIKKANAGRVCALSIATPKLAIEKHEDEAINF